METTSEELQNILREIAQQSVRAHDFRSNVEVLLRLYKNILEAAPDNGKFTRISSEKAQTKLWSKSSAMKEFMLKTGWEDKLDHIEFTEYENLRATIKLLADVRSQVNPSEEEWIAETKFERVNLNGWLDPREMALRESAAKKREEEHAACLQEMAQRRTLNELTKQQIRLDNEERSENGRLD